MTSGERRTQTIHLFVQHEAAECAGALHAAGCRQADAVDKPVAPTKIELMQTASITLCADQLAGPLPDGVRAIPSMMSVKERKFLIALAAQEYEGEGIIVDAGVFCGGSTICFGTGLRDNAELTPSIERFGKPVRTFEYGVVNPGMIPFFDRHGVLGDWHVGGSFEAYLRQNIEPVSDLVDLTIGDICAVALPTEPIEIMFLDVIKTEKIQHRIVSDLFPHLLVGGILIQQDYFVNGLPFLKIMQERLSDYFE